MKCQIFCECEHAHCPINTIFSPCPAKVFLWEQNITTSNWNRLFVKAICFFSVAQLSKDENEFYVEISYKIWMCDFNFPVSMAFFQCLEVY